MRRGPKLLLASLLAAATALPAPSAAQPANEAQRLFDEGLALMKAGRFADACPKLLESQKLDPGMGTKYRLAECYESAGLVGSAWSLFTEVVGDARAAGRADREAQAREHAEALVTRLPRLSVVVAPAIANLQGLEVTRDGDRVAQADWGRSVVVDPGAHTIAVTAPRKKLWQQTVRSLEGGSLEVTVPALEDAGASAAIPPPSAAPPPAPVVAPSAAGGSGRFIAGIALGAVGVVGVVVGSLLGGLAKSKWNTALSGCQGGDRTKCTPTAIGEGSTSSTLAAGSTAGFVAGGALLVTGVVLAVTAPKKAPASEAWEVAPAVGPGGALAVVRGRF